MCHISIRLVALFYLINKDESKKSTELGIKSVLPGLPVDQARRAGRESLQREDQVIVTHII